MDAFPPSSRLNGWKDIAAHFGKGVRTVQRWERESGLPVHRLGPGRSEAVYAFVGELERWRLTAEARRAEAHPGDGEASRSDDDAATANESTRRRVRWPALVSLGAVAVLVAVSVAAWALRRGPGAEASGSGAGPADGAQPATALVEHGVLRVRDDSGRLIWERRFGAGLTDAAYRTAAGPNPGAPVVGDIDGDGSREVLFVHEPTATASRGLYCFNADGSERFRHQPVDTVAFGPLTAAPPWRGFFVRATGDAGTPHNVWFVSSHLSEFPTVVEKLDPRGRVLGRYWSAGQVTSLEQAAVGSRRLVFVGGTNNEFKGASLAVLDEQSPSATSPAVNPHYQCTGCPAAVPLQYLVFPRLEAAIEAATYSSVIDIRIDDLGQVLLQVHHGAEPFVSYEQSLATSLSGYVLDADLHVVKAELGDKYEVIHRILEGRGLLRHPFSREAEERRLWPVLRWEGGGFVEVTRPDHAPLPRPPGANR